MPETGEDERREEGWGEGMLRLLFGDGDWNEGGGRQTQVRKANV